MAGVKVTMLRVDSSGAQPVVRLFEDADDWVFNYDRNIITLHIVKNDAPDNDGGFTRTTIAEFPATGIESVEFV